MSSTFDALMDELGSVGGTAAESSLTSYPVLGTVIRAGIDANLSGREVLASYRDIGGTITDRDYWELRNAILKGQSPPYGKDYASLVSGREVTEYPGGREGRYQVNFRLYKTYDASTNLPGNVVENYSIGMRELNIDEALSRMSYVMQNANDPTDPYGRVIGFELTSVYRYTG